MLNSVSLVIRSLGVVYVVGFFHPVDDTTPFFICIRDALRDLLPFVQFQKREKHLWSSITFSKVAARFI